MSFCHSVCLQIGGNCARSPTNNTSFVSNGNVSTTDIACCMCCSTMQNMLLVIIDISFVATLLWPSVGVKPNTWKKRGFGVFRDFRMFRAQQQGAKHLALGCSWCRWKGLET